MHSYGDQIAQNNDPDTLYSCRPPVRLRRPSGPLLFLKVSRFISPKTVVTRYIWLTPLVTIPTIHGFAHISNAVVLPFV